MPPPHPVFILLLTHLFKYKRKLVMILHTHKRREKRRWMSISKLVIIADIPSDEEKYLLFNHALQIKITILLRQCRSLFLRVSIALSMRSFYKNRHCRRARWLLIILFGGTERRLYTKKSIEKRISLFIHQLIVYCCCWCSFDIYPKKKNLVIIFNFFTLEGK